MHLVHDIDVTLLMALALAAKRRPADLGEIIAAADLLDGAVPSEAKLGDAFSRLSLAGLVAEVGGAFTLTPDAQKIMSGQSRKADSRERAFTIKEKLGAYSPQDGLPAIQPTAEAIRAASSAYAKVRNSALKNLLVSKPSLADGEGPRPGQRQRKPLPPRRKKG